MKCISQNLLLYEGFDLVPMMIKAQIFLHLGRRNMLTAQHLQILLDSDQKTLDLSIASTVVTSDHLWWVGEKCKYLTVLNASACTGLEDVGLIRVMQVRRWNYTFDHTDRQY